MVVAAAGNLDPDRFRAAAERALEGLEPGAPAGARVRAVARPRPLRSAREGEQAHVVFGRVGPGQTDPDRFAAALWASILGGSPSSRLFQVLREGHGLCYDVGTSRAEYSDGGEVCVYLATAPRDAARAAEMAVAEVERLADAGPDAAELTRHCRQLETGIWMDIEGTESRMQRLGRWAVGGGDWWTPAELTARLRAVGRNDIREFAVGLGGVPTWAAAYLGPPPRAPQGWNWMEA
jgi:predicted Zn-dependent peptidase